MGRLLEATRCMGIWLVEQHKQCRSALLLQPGGALQYLVCDRSNVQRQAAEHEVARQVRQCTERCVTIVDLRGTSYMWKVDM